MGLISIRLAKRGDGLIVFSKTSIGGPEIRMIDMIPGMSSSAWEISSTACSCRPPLCNSNDAEEVQRFGCERGSIPQDLAVCRYPQAPDSD